ncbi:D-isomer specific 2-hydroxyacid dehydrogenase [Nitrosococcus oceani ATCC 19707]|uniref:D-isomer specific 2-hydroxyacid dehydrogenase n=2 Tax=Nitrosococcus oceani TaxID=1229 RepID=Q3J9K4_NITOC|nr:2-hydroxyacid dehydrogenase [Nitrosococcus oceani]ABA58492.1 D-isomer specific 2-hydroxyacid dehydrogenase [Nitrosococcus oceani ATCC 19707]EDZ67090.1 D-isomer specific 2-hydroxyacid dehydrogenase, catalytic domain, putative [Nitrosococcus oceani AFC27]KFI19096.1 glycerate dehydrogenase [Nitrosococcus oceani C-27]GEM18889.1 glycerate dehydrogenase [Nitrosococcus oceani]
MQGVFLDQDTLHPADLDFSPLEAIISQWKYYETSSTASEIIDRIRQATIAVTNKIALTGSILKQAPHLQLVCIAATGTNNVDLEAARRLGIAVCNVRGYCTASVVEHVFALILALTRRLAATSHAATTGAWQYSPHFTVPDFPCRELAGKTFGIVGYGELGQAVARIAKAFGMTVLIAQRSNTPNRPGRIPLKDLLPLVDILSLHCPLTPETTGLIGPNELASMRSDALLINAARGGIVNEQALADALRRGHLGGAGVDVLSQEPPRHGNPLLAPDIPNLILTPHVAWNSREARQYLLTQVAKNIRSFLAGEPRNLVS